MRTGAGGLASRPHTTTEMRMSVALPFGADIAAHVARVRRTPQFRAADGALRSVRRAAGLRRLCGASTAMAYAGATGRFLRPRRTILFAPHRPMPTYVAYKMCMLLGYRIELDPRRPHDLAFRFCDATRDDRPMPCAAGVRILNDAFRDVSKSRVQECWAEAAGYPFAIDPTQHIGPAACKSDRNGTHDGYVVECPIAAPVPGYVYQHLVANYSAPGEVLEYRVPIHGDEFPVMYLKYRPEWTRFYALRNTRVELADPPSVFSPDEFAALRRFARLMEIDFGEMDILRDFTTGRIYVVDANNSPCGPSGWLTPAERGFAIRRMAETFEQLVESPPKALPSRAVAL
jgi:hypothetical protein